MSKRTSQRACEIIERFNERNKLLSGQKGSYLVEQSRIDGTSLHYQVQKVINETGGVKALSVWLTARELMMWADGFHIAMEEQNEVL